MKQQRKQTQESATSLPHLHMQSQVPDHSQPSQLTVEERAQHSILAPHPPQGHGHLLSGELSATKSLNLKALSSSLERGPEFTSAASLLDARGYKVSSSHVPLSLRSKRAELEAATRKDFP